MVSLLVVVASLFVWRAVSKISACGRNNGFVIDGDSVGIVLSKKITPVTTTESSNFQYKYYGLFLAD